MVSHKDVLLALVGIALVAFAFAGLANATTTLKTSYSSISLSASRTASVFVYAANGDYEAKTVGFSASSHSGNLELYFDYYEPSLAAKASRGATLRIAAPQNARGCDVVTTNALVCSYSGACETLSRSVRVFVSPSRESSYYVEAPFDYCIDYYEPAASLPKNRVVSRLEFVGYFDPTEYDARFVEANAPRKCERVQPGEIARFPVSLRNVGAATSFDVRLVGDKDVLNAAVSNSFVSLERSEIAELWVSVAPTHYASPGRYYVEAQAQRNGVVVASQDVCVEVEQEYGVRLAAPDVFETTNCGNALRGFGVELENTGSGRDIFGIDVSEPDWALLETQGVEARGGQKQLFEIKIDGSRLQPGTYRLGIKAVSGQSIKKTEDKVFVAVRVEPCAAPQPLAAAQANVSKEEKDELVKLLVNIENPGDAALENVSVSLEGLPEKWSYAAEAGFTVPGKSNKALQVLVKRATDEEAKGVLLKIKSGERVVGVQEIPKIESRASGLTGFFVAAGSNAWIIALIIVIALAVVVLSGRFRGPGEKEGKEEKEGRERDEAYVKRLRSLKASLDKA